MGERRQEDLPVGGAWASRSSGSGIDVLVPNRDANRSS